MIDVLLRALRHPLDYLPIFRTYTLTLKEQVKESTDVYSFTFYTQKPIVWKAGQHAIFSFPQKNITGKRWRAFSIASAPGDGVIKIATIIKDEPSAFKSILRDLRPGETITMRGPFGEMYLRPTMKTIIGIAGGIGITPFRAILRDMALGGRTDVSCTLIYSAISDYTFKAELDTLPQKNVRIIYTHTPQEVQTELDALVREHQNNASYFISGPPGMITAIKLSLTQKGITHTVNDPFKGY